MSIKALFEKYLSNRASAEDRERLLRFIRNDEQIAGWLRAELEYSDGAMPSPIRERVLSNIYEQPSKPSPVLVVKNRRWSVAAVVTVLVALSVAVTWMVGVHKQQSPEQPIASGDIVVSTGMGEHSRVTLPDGTALTLNALTTVRYNTQGGKRHAQVDGEAYFEVARDEEHPFVVQASEADITCLGTAFNVRNYADEGNVSVVLNNGKVRVSAREADVTMEPDSRVVMDRQTLALSKHTVNASDYTAWLNGEVKYNNQTLEDIAAELSRNYNISMVITSDELKHERFNGYLGRSSLRNILDVLCLASDMSYYVDNDTMVYVYPRKKN